jgi:two-component system cell cycle sensor histidine kinase/response regulator CckA
MSEINKTILVVDDDATVRRLVVEIFRNSEYQVLEASDGMEALMLLNTAGKKPIDVLLTDVIMPRMNGAELARVAVERHPATRIIFMSGHADEVVNCYGIPQSKLRYINKPFTPQVLEKAIREDLKK